jgi:peptidoglycan/LPS O-acetylase OafA/YrhL
LNDKSLMRSLEGLRFLSSTAIVMYHYVPYVVTVRSLEKLGIAVDLFFVISGIVIANHHAGKVTGPLEYFDFIKRRLARIYPLHLATLTFYVGIGLLVILGVMRVADPAKYNFSELLPNLLLAHAWTPNADISFNYVSWSISAEFFVYLLFPAILWVVGRGITLGICAVGLGLATAIAISHIGMNVDLINLNWKLGIVRAVPSFAFGVFLSCYRVELTRAFGSAACRSGFHALLALTVALIIADASSYLLLACVYGVVGCAFVCDLSNQRTLASWGPVSSLGYLTYSIYMLHPVVATVLLAAVLPKLFGVSNEAMVAAVCISTLATLALAVISYRYFEEPLRRRINGMWHFSTAGHSSQRERLGA